MKTIRIAAALLLRGDETLLVRKRGTAVFMQPGGKIESAETAVSALVRELNEEIGLEIDPAELAFFGMFEAEAANEPGHWVIAAVYSLTIADRIIRLAAEIEEVRWVSVHAPAGVAMAPLTEHYILPAYRQIRSAGRT